MNEKLRHRPSLKWPFFARVTTAMHPTTPVISATPLAEFIAIAEQTWFFPIVKVSGIRGWHLGAGGRYQ
jgi:hypothetical protein